MRAALVQHLLTDGGEHQAASHPVKKSKAEFLLEVVDLPRTGRLADVQAQRCLRDCAEFGDSDECPQAFQIMPPL
jgi:hypothetical protein